MLTATSTPMRATTVGVPRSSAIASERNAALDFTKGALVLCMIAYHTLNYFRYDESLLRHLHFLPPSFIFIAGFLITHLYLPKFRAGDHRVPYRLLVRGLKTLALFVTLNVAVHAIVDTTHNRRLGLGVLLDNIDAIFLDGDQRATVFGVLLPISYVLLLSSVVLPFARFAQTTVLIVLGSVIALCLTLSQRGELPFNLELVSMGLFGVAAGFLPRTQLDRLGRPLAPLAFAYLVYSGFVFFRYPNYAMNLVGVTLALTLLYARGLRTTVNNFASRAITLLGNYSLLSYLVQIAILQALLRTTRYFGVFEDHLVLPLCVTLLATLAVVQLTAVLRTRFTFAERTYKVVFA